MGRSGYAVRVPHSEFWKLYRNILPELEEALQALEAKPAAERAQGMLQLFEAKFSFNKKRKMWAIGKTLVFLKQQVHDDLIGKAEGASNDAFDV